MALKMVMTALAASVGLSLSVGVALAADPTPTPAPASPAGKVVLVRQAHYRELNSAFRAVNDELRKDAPDKAAITANAGKMRALAADLPSWFPKGSGPEAGVPTRAKAEIWTDAEGFAAAAGGLAGETVKLEQVAAAGDLDAIKAEGRATNGACGACHSKFRGPEPH